MSSEFLSILQGEEIKISLDGKGRVIDNIFIERFWRTLKYQEVYLHEYRTVSKARQSLWNYFLFYNMERRHHSLSYRKPSEVYFRGLKASPQVEAGS
jgi:putative transposase